MGLIKSIEQTNNLYQTWVEITSSHAEVLWLDHEMTEANSSSLGNVSSSCTGPLDPCSAGLMLIS